MLDHEQRLAWVESLMAHRGEKGARRNAAVVTTGWTDTGAEILMGISFDQVVEVMGGSAVQPIALLPQTFCGVIARGSDLYPVLDLGGDLSQPELVLLVRDRGCRYGLLFRGAPLVMDADAAPREPDAADRGAPATPAWPLVAGAHVSGPQGPVVLLDVPATTDALLRG